MMVMLFNSLEYIFLFLPIAVVIFYLVNRLPAISAGRIWLILCSFVFYSFSSFQWIPLICTSILGNFFFGTLLIKRSSESPRTMQALFILWTGILFNLLLLCYFKYTNFFIMTVNQATGSSHTLFSIALPLAISFYTFQQIAFITDCYQKKIQNPAFNDYLFFVLFFPQLIAGPILRWHEIFPKYSKTLARRINWANISTGTFVFCTGLFKKVVIADSFAAWSLPTLNFSKQIGFVDSWLASLCYTFQLYYDFSGYSDMAIGAALLFNLKLPINFNSPYRALSIQDFWRRWHITLSRWLRDYLYIPLGGSKRGSAATLCNIFITFLLGGLWHGAGWTFIAWGAMHGFALGLQRSWQKLGLQVPRIFAWLCTFLFLNFSWVYFSAPSIAEANIVVKTMPGLANGHLIFTEIRAFWAIPDFFMLLTFKNLHIIALTIFAFATFVMPNTMQMINFVPYEGFYRFKPTVQHAVLLGIMFTIAILSFIGNVSKNTFIYFQF